MPILMLMGLGLEGYILIAESVSGGREYIPDPIDSWSYYKISWPYYKIDSWPYYKISIWENLRTISLTLNVNQLNWS